MIKSFTIIIAILQGITKKKLEDEITKLTLEKSSSDKKYMLVYLTMNINTYFI